MANQSIPEGPLLTLKQPFCLPHSHLCKKASGHMSLYEALLSKSAQGHLQGYFRAQIIRQSSYISKEPHTTAVSKRLFIRRIHASHFDGFHVARSYGRFPQQHCGLEHIFFSAGSNIRSRSKTRSAALFPPQCWTYLFKIHLALVSLTWEGPPATFCKRFLLRLGKSSEAIFGAASVILWASLAPYADIFVPHPAQRASAQVRGTCHVKCGNRQRLRLVGLGRGTCGHCFAQLCLNVLFCCTTFSACSVDRSSSAKKL